MVQVADNTQMTLAAMSKDYTVYNCWANTTLVNWLRSKPAESMGYNIPSSFSSLKSTLVHIWRMQDWWLANLQGRQIESFYGVEFEGPVSEVFDNLIRQSEEFTAYVQSLSDAALRGQYGFSIPTVGDFTHSGYEIIQHCMNHSTYHRGQIITIARNLNFTDAPMTDYMFYLLMV